MKIDQFNTELSWEYENGFYLTSDLTRMGKLLSHWELYKMIADIPGHIVECGVYKGVSLIQWATFRNLLENPFSRKIIGFDMFGPFPEGNTPQDKAYVEKWNILLKGSYMEKESIESSLKMKKLERIELIKGNLLSTLPEYIKGCPELKIALLHIDTDLEEPALCTLELLWPRLVTGGIAVLDDYGAVAGGTCAVDSFFKDINIQIKKLRISHEIPAYVVKP
ncbi:conserved hypothetical protein [Desulfamplus magnetovallimortis]|uniref:dTDP-6-deoxy-L-hexose 3-O-methyltransferase n=1 Tax=Desulfamplus magnetovallimortis TaxID=1246637 RepID=A0A1W1HEN9_9BACT|nr:TylF/MycF/NovP-related O-methyltransferase [Desulfamplus magnetovallimortis]SLM30964.1 conserved hypothetical protein [Desulfamplus magnetovallimortis]